MSNTVKPCGSTIFNESALSQLGSIFYVIAVVLVGYYYSKQWWNKREFFPIK